MQTPRTGWTEDGGLYLPHSLFETGDVAHIGYRCGQQIRTPPAYDFWDVFIVAVPKLDRAVRRGHSDMAMAGLVKAVAEMVTTAGPWPTRMFFGAGPTGRRRFAVDYMANEGSHRLRLGADPLCDFHARSCFHRRQQPFRSLLELYRRFGVTDGPDLSVGLLYEGCG